MAKKKKKKVDNSPDGQKKARKSKAQLLIVCGAVFSIILLPTTILLVIGMTPTFVALFLDRSKRKSKTITVGALNLAGCMPILLKLWTSEHSVEASLALVSTPKTIVMMYSMAVVGYMLDWALTGMIASLLYQKGLDRRDQIERRQIELIERWGEKVTGNIPVDERGFPLDGSGNAGAVTSDSKK